MDKFFFLLAIFLFSHNARSTEAAPSKQEKLILTLKKAIVEKEFWQWEGRLQTWNGQNLTKTAQARAYLDFSSNQFRINYLSAKETFAAIARDKKLWIAPQSKKFKEALIEKSGLIKYALLLSSQFKTSPFLIEAALNYAFQWESSSQKNLHTTRAKPRINDLELKELVFSHDPSMKLKSLHVYTKNQESYKFIVEKIFKTQKAPEKNLFNPNATARF